MVESRREREKQREKNQTAQGQSSSVLDSAGRTKLWRRRYRILGRLTRLSAVKKTLFDEGPG